MSKTRQEIFDIAYRGLASQGFRRSFENGACMYRSKDGRKCAIGWCIDDEDYSPEFEGKTPFYMPWIREAAGIEFEDRQFSENLQLCHDESRDCRGVKARLREFAKQYNLTIPEVSP